MASKFRAIVAPMVIEMLRTVTCTFFFPFFYLCLPIHIPYYFLLLAVPAASLSTDDLFQRDAIYAAVQMGSYDLYDFMDFDALLANTLVHDVAAAHPWAKVLRRRVALLIGAWVTVKVRCCCTGALMPCFLLFCCFSCSFVGVLPAFSCFFICFACCFALAWVFCLLSHALSWMFARFSLLFRDVLPAFSCSSVCFCLLSSLLASSLLVPHPLRLHCSLLSFPLLIPLIAVGVGASDCVPHSCVASRLL